MIKASAADIEISFEIINVDDNAGSINFTIKIEFSPFLQKATYQIRNLKIDKSELLKFEEQLIAGEEAELCDINAQVVLYLKHTAKFDIIEIQPLSTEVVSDYNRLNITMRADHLLISRLAASFKKYPKWW